MLRLRLWKPPGGAVCQLRRQAEQGGDRGADEGKQQCGKLLGSERLHPLQCEHGAAKMRPHDAVKAALSTMLHRAGAAVDVERVIPELADSVKRVEDAHSLLH